MVALNQSFIAESAFRSLRYASIEVGIRNSVCNFVRVTGPLDSDVMDLKNE